MERIIAAVCNRDALHAPPCHRPRWPNLSFSWRNTIAACRSPTGATSGHDAPVSAVHATAACPLAALAVHRVGQQHHLSLLRAPGFPLRSPTSALGNSHATRQGVRRRWSSIGLAVTAATTHSDWERRSAGAYGRWPGPSNAQTDGLPTGELSLDSRSLRGPCQHSSQCLACSSRSMLWDPPALHTTTLAPTAYRVVTLGYVRCKPQRPRPARLLCYYVYSKPMRGHA